MNATIPRNYDAIKACIEDNGASVCRTNGDEMNVLKRIETSKTLWQLLLPHVAQPDDRTVGLRLGVWTNVGVYSGEVQ
jgi:hypothetical protein